MIKVSVSKKKTWINSLWTSVSLMNSLKLIDRELGLGYLLAEKWLDRWEEISLLKVNLERVLHFLFL